MKMKIVSALIINIFAVQCVKAIEIESPVISGLLPRYQSSFTDKDNMKADQGSMLQLLRNKPNLSQNLNNFESIASAEAYKSRGDQRAASGDKQGALSDFNQALRINPDYAQAYNSRGSIRAELDDRQGAISDFSQALRINPKDTKADDKRRGLLFSTTPKIKGSLIFGGGSVSGTASARNLNPLSKESLSLLAGISITTSFTEYDRLRASFIASAFGAPTSQDPDGYTPEGSLSWTDGILNNKIGLESLTYQFPASPTTEIALAVKGGDSIGTIVGQDINPHFSGSGFSGSISYFGSSPSFYNYASGTGLGIQQKLGSQFELGIGYLSQKGLLTGKSAGLARLLYKPNDKSKIGLTYVNSDRTQTDTGSRNVNNVYAQSTNQTLGLEGYYQFSSNFGLGGWIGHTNSNASGGNATSLSWAVSAAFPNNGNIIGLLVGQEPHVTSSSGSLNSFTDPDSSLHLEAFYQYKINDILSITPGVIYVTAPDSNGQNGGSLIGVIRTKVSFSF
jgi:tetratricopeptide (TPR) repeat protein